MLCPRRFLQLLLCTVCALQAAAGQAPAPWRTPLNAITLGAEYSNDSSHIILGQSFNRRFGGLDLTYSRRVGSKTGIAYTWDIEARPLVLLEDPVATTTYSFTINSLPPAVTTYSNVPVQSRCGSFTSTDTFPVSTVPGVTTETVSVRRECDTRCTYGWGLSPVGQRLNFWPRRTLQPYLLANGGFLVSTRDIPVNDSSRFNFTFTFGTGLQWFKQNGASWAIDYRVQHLSNKKIGDNNPGIDSQTFRLSYSIPGWPGHPRASWLHR